MSASKRVVIESPYAGDVEANLQYARRALKDSLDRGEAPMASHLLYTQVYDDNDPAMRERGLMAGWAYIDIAEALVVYTDRGISRGMRGGIAHAESLGIPVEYRSIDE